MTVEQVTELFTLFEADIQELTEIMIDYSAHKTMLVALDAGYDVCWDGSYKELCILTNELWDKYYDKLKELWSDPDGRLRCLAEERDSKNAFLYFTAFKDKATLLANDIRLKNQDIKLYK